MKQIFILFFTIFYFVNVYSGDKKGNGGDILVCTNSPYDKTSLDLYESIEKFNLTPNIPISNKGNEIETALEMIKRMNTLSPRRYLRLKELIKNFYNEVQWVHFPLGTIDDSGTIDIPKDCKLFQVVNQNPKILIPSKSYLINKEVWEPLSFPSKVSLILHEVIYKDTPSETSEGVRAFNSLIIGDHFKNLAFTEYLNSIIAWGFDRNTIGQIEVNLKQPFEFYENGSLKYATPIDASLLYLFGNWLPVRDTSFKFYENAVPYEFCPRKPFDYKTRNFTLNVYCYVFGNYIPIRLYPNGNLSQGVAHYQEILIGEYKLFLGRLSRGIQLSAAFELYDNGSLKLVYDSELEWETNERKWEFGKKEAIRFFPNSNLESATLLKEIHYTNRFLSANLVGRVSFYQSATLASAIASRNFPLKIQGQLLEASPQKEFKLYPDGSVREISLNKEAVLLNNKGEKTLVSPNQNLNFDTDGFLK